MPLGRWQAVPRGLAFHHCEGRLVSGAVPPPAARSLGRAAGVLRPAFPWARLVWALGPSVGPTVCGLASRRCVLWGWREGVPGGVALCRCERCLSSGALPPPAVRPQGWLWGSLPTCCGRGCAGVGPQHRPFGLHALRRAVCCGGGGRLSPGGWISTVVRGVWCKALSLPRPPVPWSGQPGFRDPCFPGAVVVGVGTQHRPQACALASRRCALWGWRGGVPRGGCPAPL